ncbi:hydroxyacid dehydrogenase [Myceligenerans pegani]|uniref:Hydroxyacid dehydrogenase n=1 Tax=Myceligenerans pegani TaxID=2776917 RepID=A0ABR9MY56_9MICO|nr:hydroxyacid dehydrogenase [Myceligenerans sp. TRM 65318]MBE1876305.1 hydroxyacid dehydrogenase [Myceligenerans sp. TRM 65318]MBE3018576.1 hydroxyacid dehydrogenase [Myceligenerans sp. TRM 65318]
MIEYAVAVGSDRLAERLFGPGYEALADVPARRIGEVLTEFESDEARRVLSRVEVLLTGWGAPSLPASVLRHAPRLRRVIHAGGGAGYLFPDGPGDVAASDVGMANAIPVAELTLAMILLANKEAFRARDLLRERRAFIDREDEFPTAGNYGRTVGLVSASRIGRLVIDLLRPFPSLRVLVYDPFLTIDDAASLGVEKVELAELARRSDVVSLHAPVVPETVGMIDAGFLALMPHGATLINTARGVIVDAAALEKELVSGRINAILDVTDPEEPLPATSPLYDLPNVFLTPHIAGSMGTELRRMGDWVAADLAHYAQEVASGAND